jgi:hypothetical protein
MTFVTKIFKQQPADHFLLSMHSGKSSGRAAPEMVTGTTGGCFNQRLF